MGQQVDLSEDLVADARAIAEASQRSIADQIELWAELGRAIEPLIQGGHRETFGQPREERSLAEAIREVGTEAGRKRLQDYLQSRPFPHFEAVPGSPGLLRRIEADGTEIVGRFVNRVFEAVEP